MITIKDILKTLSDDRKITINLLLTEKCNFKCEHCFYGSGPSKPKAYISDEILYQVGQMINTLEEAGIYTDLNLIGGEPTVNLNEFARVWRWAEGFLSGDVNLEMTTNGWWLSKPESARKFFEIVGRTAYEWDDEDLKVSIRISGDGFHEPFRTGNNTDGPSLQGMLEEILERGSLYDEPVTYKFSYTCGSCDYVIENQYAEEDQCPKCGNEMYYDDERLVNMPEYDPGFNWIYVDTHLDWSNVVPSGIRGQFGSNTFTCTGENNRGFYLTFLPNGNHSDGCCRGSNMPFGRINDHPLVLLALIQNFFNDKEPECYNCRTKAQGYARSNKFLEVREALIQELEELTDEKELSEWLEEFELQEVN
jgi:hypothetical protein